MINTTNEALRLKISHLGLQLLHFGRATVGRSWRGLCAKPAFSRLYYIVGGEATLFGEDGKITNLTPNRWVLIPAGYSFDFSCASQMEHIYFHLTLSDVDGYDRLSAFTTPAVIDTLGCDASHFSSLIESDSLRDGLLLRHRAEEVLFAFLEEFDVHIEESTLSPCVLLAIRYIRQHLSASLTLEEIAEQAYVSKSTLTKHFKRELSVSVCAYVMDTVLFKAGQALLKTELSVLEISEKYGFSDSFYFSRCFKKKFGISPLRYRKTVIS